MAARALMAQPFRALRNYNYRLFWFGQLVSQSGTWMQRIGQAWLVLKLTDSPVAVGVVTALQTLPVLLLTLVGGVLADRLPKRRVLLGTQSVAAVQALTLAFLTSAGVVRLWHVFALATVLGLATAFDGPARQAFVAEMVDRRDLPNAVALNATLVNAARIVGPALGGITIATVGIAGTFFANAASFVPILAALVLMRPALFYGTTSAPRAAMLQQVGEGLAFVRATPAAFVVLLVMAVVGTFGYNFTVTLPLVARFVLHTSAVEFGTLTSFMGVGAIAGALALASASPATYRRLFGSAALFSLFFLGVALSGVLPLTAALLVVLGGMSITYTATANTLLQLISPDRLRGRLMSIHFLLFQGTTPIGGALTGLAAARFGVPETLAGEAILCAAGAGLGAWYYLAHRDSIRQAVARQAHAARPAPAPAGP